MKHITIFFVSMLFIAFGVTAEEEKEEEKKEKVSYSYLEIKPAIVTNYGGVGKLRYFKSNISLRVEASKIEQVSWHSPYIRSTLVSIFSRQDEEALTTREGKAGLRQEALEAIQKVLEEEEGEALVEDVLFTNFIIQK